MADATSTLSPSPGFPDEHHLSDAQWRMIVLASLGGALEFYDFIVYGIFAQEIGGAFFPSEKGLVSLILTFSVFAVGYFARPVGGMVLSHYGDKYGRRNVFIVSLLIVSLCTFGIGLIPGYASWGVAAPGLLVLLRLAQGFFLGGELPGAITYVVETDRKRACFVCGFVFFCVQSGVVLASLISLTVRTFLSPADVAAWGWRIGFLFGGVTGFGSYLLQRSLRETPEFREMKITAKLPAAEVLRDYTAASLVGIATVAVVAGFNGLLFAHMPAYLGRVLHYSAREAALAQNVCLATMDVSLLLSGWLGDRISRIGLLRAGALMMILGAYPFYVAIAAHSPYAIWLFGLAGLVAGLPAGTFACVLADLFPTRVRFSGVALTFNIAFTVFSGMAPLLVTWLIGALKSPLAPSWFMIACAVIAFLGSFGLAQRSGQIRKPVDSQKPGLISLD